ncbi:unnamed protein product [Porites lobata]|uniref:alanine transaminase n=1 Tax=Porites lobata TaxID=104759 RepID=A0ABN8R5V3_9CNID|nr:unnamed protein product [Porites lobata]
MAAEEIITDKTIGHVYQNYATSRPWTDLRAHEIQRELKQAYSLGAKGKQLKSPSKVGQGVDWGLGLLRSLIFFLLFPAIKKQIEVIESLPFLYITFLACLLCPSLLEEPSYPQDIKEKARRILEATEQFSIGSYTDTSGLRIVREHVARFITKRDGYTADPDSIILTSGGASGIKIALDALSTGYFCSDEDRAGLMTPIPCFFHYPTWIKRLNLYQIPYYLDEDNDWALDIHELQRALNESKPHCRPRGLVLINPGNPTGQVLSYDNIKEVIKFCAREKLVLFADEVYQETVFTNEVQFHSCKKVLRDLGPEYNKFQLMSINSASKGFYGECGLRGAYIELVGFSKEVLFQVKRYCSPPCTVPSSIAQAAVSAICNPPQPGDESYETFIKEKMAILDSYQRKAKITTKMLNSLKDVSCNPVTGSLYAFPKVILPQKAVEEAKLKIVHLTNSTAGRC